jgi:hypothetical protein
MEWRSFSDILLCCYNIELPLMVENASYSTLPDRNYISHTESTDSYLVFAKIIYETRCTFSNQSTS